MKYNNLIVSSFFYCILTFLFCQNKPKEIAETKYKEPRISKKVFDAKTKKRINLSQKDMPRFLGCEQDSSLSIVDKSRCAENEMFRFLYSNIKISKSTKNIFSERVMTKFVIKEDGSIDKIKILRGEDERLNKEIIRVIKSMPKWIPAKSFGNPMEVEYSIPLRIRFE